MLNRRCESSLLMTRPACARALSCCSGASPTSTWWAPPQTDSRRSSSWPSTSPTRLLAAAAGAVRHEHGGTATAGAAPPPDGLTQRELEVLRLIARGLTNPEIAAQLFLSNHTIKTHIGRIFAKTGSRDRAAAIGYA